MEKEMMQLISELVEIKTKYNILIDYLIYNSTLNYNETEIRFDGVEKIFRTLEPEFYDDRLDALQSKKENE